jgi:chromosome segregation ATPase
MSDNSTETLNDSHDHKLDQILDGLQELRTRLEQVETKVDERLRETRPIWEAVQTQLNELREADLAIQSQIEGAKRSLQAQIEELKDAQQSFRAEVEKSFRLVDRRMEMYSEMVSRVHLYQRDLEDRVDELAKRPG